MKNALIILLLITANFCSNAQTGIIKGNIHDKGKNEGLAFATVFLVHQNRGTTTNQNGDFTIENVPIGTYDLCITYIGYPDTTLTSIKVTKDTLIDIRVNYPQSCPYSQKHKTCPVCKKQDKVIPIIYGLPNQKLLKKAKKERVKLGGCMISNCDPYWFCKRDKKKF